MHYIGDVHGNFSAYKHLLSTLPESVQIGDMGVGFGRWDEDPLEQARVDMLEVAQGANHKFIRGNHDNPAVCKSMNSYIADGTVVGNTMHIGGALSIDANMRTAAWDYWEDEELSYDELFNLIDVYEKVKPEIMVTHECPESVVGHLFNWYAKEQWPSRTRQAFDSMFAIHKPKIWVFGHWHYSVFSTQLGTTFICLNELSTIEITDTYISDIKPFNQGWLLKP